MPTAKEAAPAPMIHGFATLRALGLDDDELSALRRQGYIQRDRRAGGSRTYLRLRFRVAGRMRTVYLGTDERLAANVQRELDLLQAPRRKKLQLARAVQLGRQTLRRTKLRLVPTLAELGMHYHGDTIRQRRPKQPFVTGDASSPMCEHSRSRYDNPHSVGFATEPIERMDPITSSGG
jgi:hypothetical protein